MGWWELAAYVAGVLSASLAGAVATSMLEVEQVDNDWSYETLLVAALIDNDAEAIEIARRHRHKSPIALGAALRARYHELLECEQWRKAGLRRTYSAPCGQESTG